MAATTDEIKRHGLTVPRKKKLNDSAETYEITVEGAGYFPPDMLRYDRCWPATQVDVDKAFTRVRDDIAVRRQVVLRSYDLPTPARWLSFGWRVVGLR